MGKELGGLRVWVVCMLAIGLVVLGVALADPRLGNLLAWTYFFSESTIAFWHGRGHTLGESIFIATLIGDFSAFNWWFLGYQDLSNFEKAEKFFDRIPLLGRYIRWTAESLRKTQAFVVERIDEDHWARKVPYILILGICLFLGIPVGVPVARFFELNKWIILPIVLMVSTGRNYLVGKFIGRFSKGVQIELELGMVALMLFFVLWEINKRKILPDRSEKIDIPPECL